jgi:TPP-dependent pyruvate/acetoin dehydrogenase alpha subunit
MLRSMLLIRRFEESLRARKDVGFQLFSSGEEAVSVGVCAGLRSEDQLLCSGRSIGPALARGVSASRVMAEALGREGGPCGGRGGRGHLAATDNGFFGAHAVVGGNLTIAAGVALALQVKGAGVVVCMFGDGACGAGALHETLNMAAVWRLPLLFVCNNNQYSISTPRSAVLAARSLSDLASPFGVPGVTVDGMDVVAVRNAAQSLLNDIRGGAGPAFLECLSGRFSTHSTATRETRSQAELDELRARCPIETYANRLRREGGLIGDQRLALECEVDQAVREANRFADVSPYPEVADLARDVG